MFPKFRDSDFEICLHIINSNFLPYFLSSSTMSSGAETSKEILPEKSKVSLPAKTITFSFHFSISVAPLKIKEVYWISFLKLNTASNISIDSLDSNVSFMEQLSKEPRSQRNNSPNNLNLTKLSETSATEMLTVSSVASPNHKLEFSTMTSLNWQCGFGRQLPIIPPSLNDLNLPPNPFNILATMRW